MPTQENAPSSQSLRTSQYVMMKLSPSEQDWHKIKTELVNFKMRRWSKTKRKTGSQ